MPSRLQDLGPEERLSKDQEYDTLPIGTQVARDFLDVHKGGLTYRLRIHCDRCGRGRLSVGVHKGVGGER